MTTVFLSHASQDDKLAEQLTGWLTRNGFTDLFVDHANIRVGDRWADALRNAKASCRIVLCLVTPPWLESDECYGEFMAGWYAGKRIMPLLAICGAALNERQHRRLARVLGEDQGFDLATVGAPGDLAFDAQPKLAATLVAGLKAGGALAKIGLDPFAFEIDVTNRPEPFPGLESFGDEDAGAAIFFGRSPEIAACIEDLREMRASGDRRAYAILGASGSGKSSLMKAGVLPRLRRERGWLVLRSFRPGADPLYNFADAIARTAADLQVSWAPGSIYEELLTAWRAARRANVNTELPAKDIESGSKPQTSAAFDAALVEVVERRIRSLRDLAEKTAATCLVAIDQAEELAQNHEESGVALSDFIAALSAIAVVAGSEGATIPYRFIFTVRDDAFAELHSSPNFARVLTRPAYIHPLPLYRFAHAIEQPAERYGVVMEPTLVQAMIEDAPETNALPLLAFALRRLWTRFAVERRIRRSNYELFGKLPGLIEDAAERALRAMDPRDDSPLTPVRISAEREKRMMRVFIPALAQIDESGHPLRRLAPVELFSDEDRELLAPFHRWRLLTSRGSAIEVSHEVMFREWPRFAQWLKLEGERLEALREAEAAAQAWESQGRKPEYLTHRKRRLALAEILGKNPGYKRQMDAIGPLKPYLSACRRAERMRLLSAAVISSLVAVTIFTLVATNMLTLRRFMQIAADVQAALPGASFATDQIREELDIRRTVLHTVLQRSMTNALERSRAMAGAGDGAVDPSKLNPNTDPWSLAQIAAALGRGTSAEAEQLRAYFDATISPECQCWSGASRDGNLAATAWVVLGQINRGVQLRSDILDGILSRQNDDGSWPLFFDAARVTEWDSTYATAITLLALHELSPTDYRAIDRRIRAATAQAAMWLHTKAPKGGQYWVDYPYRRNALPSRGLSAIVTYVLLTTAGTSEDQALFNEWFATLGSPSTMDPAEASEQFVALPDGTFRLDNTHYMTLGWELATIGKGAAHLNAFQRIRARRFFLDALQTWPRDQTGRYDYVMAETLFAINTLFTGAGRP